VSGAIGDGLVHLGLLHDGPDDLVDSAIGHVRRALADGDDVRVVVDRRTARAFGEALGADAERVTFPPPSSTLPPSAPGFLSRVQGWARPDRRTTVLGCYPGTMSAPDCGFGEDGVNLVLRDLPLTLICTCRRDLDPDLLAVARRSHPVLATTAGPAENPEFRPPTTSIPTPAALWGEVAARIGVDGTADLAEVRQRVGDVAAQAGLAGDAVRAAVLAVHEAAVLLVRGGARARAVTVEVRARPGEAVFSEVSADVPGTPATVATEGDRHDPLAHLRPFCSRVSLHDEPERRAVRVLTTV
jgi:hypothetical protein